MTCSTDLQSGTVHQLDKGLDRIAIANRKLCRGPLHLPMYITHLDIATSHRQHVQQHLCVSMS